MQQQKQIQKQHVMGVVSVSSPTGGEDSSSMAKWQKRHSKMHMLSLRFLRWARSITNQGDACKRESDVVAVPAHVVTALQQQQSESLSPTQQQMALSPSGGGAAGAGKASASAASASAAGTRGGQGQGTKHRRKPSSGLPDLMEEEKETPSTPGADTPDNSTHNRSCASSESPSFGSTYV